MNLFLGDTQLIIAECMKHGLLRNQAAYVLATARWETAHTMEPVRETLASSDASAIARLNRAFERGQLRWVSRPYWNTGFFGRGYVQLTHEANYRKAGNTLSIDLVGNPSLALEAETAAQILVIGSRDGWFTGKKLSDYITLKASNFRGARRIINGTDQAAAIAEIARDYDAALKADGYGVQADVPIANDRRDGAAPRIHVGQTKTIWAMIMAALGTASQAVQPAKEAVAPIAEAFGLTPEQGLAIVVAGGIAFVIYDRNRKFKTQDDR